MKKSASSVKENIMKLFETKIKNNISKDCQPKHIAGVFDDKYKSEDDEQLTIEEFLEIVRLYLHDMINDLKKSGEWKFN